MNAPLRVDRDRHVTTLALNRPGKRTAPSAELVDAMLAALQTAQADGG